MEPLPPAKDIKLQIVEIVQCHATQFITNTIMIILQIIIAQLRWKIFKNYFFIFVYKVIIF